MILESLAAQFSLAKEISEYNLKKADDTSKNTKSSDSSNETKNLIATLSSKQDAVVVDTKDAAFNQKLYKHINDYYKGEGYRSKETSYQLADKDQKNSTALNNGNPEAARLYSAYRTAGFSYNSKARFVSGIDNVVKFSTNLKKVT